MIKFVIRFTVMWVMLLYCHYSIAQSPDSRICNCFTKAISSDFMLGTKAAYGRIALFLSRDMELKPNQSQPVKFTIPVLEAKQGCTSSYTLYIADERGTKIYEATGRNNEFTYSFNDCNKVYEVRLLSTAKSVNGGDGNCSRSIGIKVKPVCNTTVCNCFIDKSGRTGSSGDVNINGKVECLSSSATQHRYVLKFDIINKTNCILNVQTITVHGQTIEVPKYNTSPLATTRGISLGFSTPLTQAPPADSKLNIVVRYMLNDKKCTVTMEVPYYGCN